MRNANAVSMLARTVWAYLWVSWVAYRHRNDGLAAHWAQSRAHWRRAVSYDWRHLCWCLRYRV